MKKAVALILSLILVMMPLSAYAHERVIDVDSGAPKDTQIVSVNRMMDTSSGERRLIMTGLNEQNRDLVTGIIADNYDETDLTPIKLVDDSFVDAEKFDGVALPGKYYDANHCWAAAASNVLWLTGWAPVLTDPLSGESFASEDKVFEFFNRRFTDNGSEANVGIDWFFTGENYFPSVSRDARLIAPVDPADGVLKEFFSPGVQTLYDLAEDVSCIAELERLDRDSSEPCCFCVSIGTLYEDTIGSSSHALTAAGIVIDPAAGDISGRYKAIILIDSDNDSAPVGEEAEWESPSVEQMNAAKEARPNSYTLYYLSYCYDINGAPYWKIENYLEPNENDDDVTFIRSFSSMPLASEEILSENTETEGTKSISDTPDFAVEDVFTTSVTEPIDRMYRRAAYLEAIEDHFEYGDPINIGFYVSNRSSIFIDGSYYSDKEPMAFWKIFSYGDGSCVVSGSGPLSYPLINLMENCCILPLADENGERISLPGGSYVVYISVNDDRSVPEAYFLNNAPKSFEFTVTGGEEPSSDPTPQPPASEPSGDEPSGSDPAVPAEKSVPDTGVAGNIWLYAALVMISVLTAGEAVSCRRKTAE